MVDDSGESEGDGEGGCVPESWWEVEDDGRASRQMAHSSTGRSTSSLWVKDKEGGGRTKCLKL